MMRLLVIDILRPAAKSYMSEIISWNNEGAEPHPRRADLGSRRGRADEFKTESLFSWHVKFH